MPVFYCSRPINSTAPSFTYFTNSVTFAGEFSKDSIVDETWQIIFYMCLQVTKLKDFYCTFLNIFLRENKNVWTLRVSLFFYLFESSGGNQFESNLENWFLMTHGPSALNIPKYVLVL